jgi:tetratricopeptide (TPR) repeat protein
MVDSPEAQTGGIQESLTPWQMLFEAQARKRFPEKIEEALVNSRTLSTPTKMPALATLLRAAVVAADEIATDKLAELVRFSLDTILIVGVGPEFSEYMEFAASALQLIELIEVRGAGVSALLLRAARFQAGLGNGSPERRRLIERAVAASQSTSEKIPALLTLARFEADLGHYRSAKRKLNACQGILPHSGHRYGLPDFHTTSGFYYFHVSDRDRARRHFNEAIRLGRGQMHEPGVSQAVSTAIHFLGLIAADQGECVRAIQLFTQAEELADPYLTGHGYYHLRVAELLLTGGRESEIRFHLQKASEIFMTTQQVSTGRAMLDGVWAIYHLRLRELDAAEELLEKALSLSRIHGGRHVELTLLATRAQLRFRQRRLVGMLASMAHRFLLHVRVDLSRGGHGPVGFVGAVVMGLIELHRQIRSISIRGEDRSMVSCPCGGHGDDPPTDRRP